MEQETNPNRALDDYEPESIEPPPDLPGYTPPVFLRWQEKDQKWLPKLGPKQPQKSPCEMCRQALWSRARVTNRLVEDNETEEITQAFCRVMHSISYSSAEPNNGADDDYVMSCDGPYLRSDKEAD